MKGRQRLGRVKKGRLKVWGTAVATRWEMSRKEGLGPAGTGPARAKSLDIALDPCSESRASGQCWLQNMLKRKRGRSQDRDIPTVSRAFLCEKGGRSFPHFTDGQTEANPWAQSAQGWSRNAKGCLQAGGPSQAGHRLAYVSAGGTLLVACAQVCGSSSWPGAMPSPHRSGSKPPFSPGLPRKPFASFGSPLINAPSICHLRPPLPTLSRGLPRTAPKSSTACLLPAASWLPAALPTALPRLQPLSQAGLEQSEPRIDQEREENRKPTGLSRDVLGSPTGLGVAPD